MFSRACHWMRFITAAIILLDNSLVLSFSTTRKCGGCIVSATSKSSNNTLPIDQIDVEDSSNSGQYPAGQKLCRFLNLSKGLTIGEYVEGANICIPVGAAARDAFADSCGGHCTFELVAVNAECEVWWREVHQDVIPPIPELVIPLGVASQGEKVALCRDFNGHLGALYLEGERYGQCFYTQHDGTTAFLDGGRFHVLQGVRREETDACAESEAMAKVLRRKMFALLDSHITPEDERDMENITGKPFVQLRGALAGAGSCFFEQVMSNARFVPSDANVLGLHALRCLLAERMYHSRIRAHGFEANPAYAQWRRDGLLVKDFDEVGEEGLHELLRMVSGENNAATVPRPPYDWAARNVTVMAGHDFQTDMHVDTFAAAIKVWVFGQGITSEHGPLNYAKGSQRNTVGKMRWLHAYSLPPASEALREPSFRLLGSPTATAFADQFVRDAQANRTQLLSLAGARKTLVIADTSGLHHRGIGVAGRTRVSWRLRGDTDGGLKRLNPFRWPLHDDVIVLRAATLGSQAQLQLSGCNTDCGRVEVRHGNSWRPLCAPEWTMVEANAVCRTLGFSSAFAAMPRFGGGEDLKSIRARVSCPDDTEVLLSACDIEVPIEDEQCTNVGVACTAAGTDRSDQDMAAVDVAIGKWKEDAEARRTSSDAPSSAAGSADCEILDGVPLPFSLEEASSAFVFVDRISAEYADMDRTLRKRLCGDRELQQKLVSMVDRGLRWNALGMDLSTFAQNATRAELDLVQDLYSSHNPHALIHENLDQPLRYKTHEVCSQNLELDARARDLFLALQADGFVHIDDFGLSDEELSALSQTAEALFRGDSDAMATRNAAISRTSGGLVSTARLPLPQVDRVLRNATLSRVIDMYLGESVLDGYKVTRLATKTMRDKSAYVASMWHHDRTGRRLKLFLYLHDVDCAEGHPTQVAIGTNNMLYHRTDSLHASRFRDEYVRGRFNVTLICGKRGSGFIFDTHSIHKGTHEGNHSRTTVIAEFHNVLKCPAVRRLGYQLPCPSGDQYMVQRRLEW